VCHTDTFTNTNTKLILLWVTRSRSPELVFYRFSNQRVYNPVWHWCPCSRSGYCWRGVALVRCIGVYLASVYESNGGSLASVLMRLGCIVFFRGCVGLCHRAGMMVAPRMEGYVASVVMRGCVAPLKADRLYSGAVFKWRGFCRLVSDVQYLWADRTVC
jgi:hypothetical protein